MNIVHPNFTSKLLSSLCLISFASFLAFYRAPSYCFLVLLLCSIFFALFLKQEKNSLHQDDKNIIACFTVYALGILGLVLLHNDDIRHFERATRFLLIIPIFIMLLKHRFKPSYLFYGAAMGAMIAFIIAMYQTQYLDLPRAFGFVGGKLFIRFGNISLTLALISTVGACLYFYHKKTSLVLLSVAGAFCGVSASILSGSRGGWIALPLIGVFLYWQTRSLFNVKTQVLLLSCICVFFTAAILTPQTNMLHRINATFDNITNYTSGEQKRSSLGDRFEMWKASWLIFKQHPIVGAGEENREVIANNLYKQNIVTRGGRLKTHSHNDFLEALSVRGLLGLALLLMLYIVPLRLFLTKLKKYPNNWEIRPYAITGAMVVMVFIDYGLSSSLFNANITTIFYCFCISFFWAAIRWQERTCIVN